MSTRCLCFITTLLVGSTVGAAEPHLIPRWRVFQTVAS